ncbi:Transport and Golgi organisation 2 [Sinosporangium album]|uniref:Transport and Golgi organisation 2 n=1 Tax=Sinosporangium album TaxID=504805 RepID=A0A1G8FZF6_9ACTN|nr:NRDE family protein [Sinosporangium album]SDH87504.1 Transport and Golgi organisation 2 [Sinosporangium album]
MCTVVVDIDPASAVPLLLVGVRDELAGRPSRGPGEHWPGLPGVLGGIDLRAGGTWLAAEPSAPRVAALLNAQGVPASDDRRVSRGELPLRTVRGGEPPEGDLRRYDPFHLLLGDAHDVRLWTWDGVRLSQDKLPPGTHVIGNRGWAAPGDEKADFFGPRFAAAPRPPVAEAAISAAPEEFWGEWLEWASGAGLPYDDPRAMVVRHETADGQVWGSLSVTLVALVDGALRYDFRVLGDDPGPWERVLPALP